MTININPELFKDSIVPSIKASGYIYTYDESGICGYHSFKVKGVGEIKVAEHVEISGSCSIKSITLNIIEALLYEEVIITGPLNVPLCFEGKGIIETSTNLNLSECFQWEFPDVIKMKLMNVLSQKPEYITTDLRELLNLHRITLPELGEGIDYDACNVMENLNNQDKIKFHVLKSKVVGFRSEEMVRNWLVGILYYNNLPCVVFLNAYWDNYSNYPLRYILNTSAFKEVVTYIKSLLFPVSDFDGINLYNTNHDINSIKFRLNTESYTMVLDEPLSQQALIEMDNNISKFLSLYTSYRNI